MAPHRSFPVIDLGRITNDEEFKGYFLIKPIGEDERLTSSELMTRIRQNRFISPCPMEIAGLSKCAVKLCESGYYSLYAIHKYKGIFIEETLSLRDPIPAYAIFIPRGRDVRIWQYQNWFFVKAN